LAFPGMHAHEMPPAVQFGPLQREIEMPLVIPPVRIAVGNPFAAVPDHDRAADVLALRDRALEFVVFDGVILDVNGEAVLAEHETGTFGHRPAFHDPIELQAEVIVQAPRRMFLDNESVALAAADLPA